MKSIDWQELSPNYWLGEIETPTHVQSLVRFLSDQGTFHFPTLGNGLFPAANADGVEFQKTGYRYVWLRDNVLIAHAHFQVGQFEIASQCVVTLWRFFEKHRSKLRRILNGSLDVRDPMNRPHIRFDGERLVELEEKWAHAQNDALGYLLWFTSLLVRDSVLSVDQIDWDLLAEFVAYLRFIEYWEDEDSGHWEEVRKVAASSIGVVVAAFRVLEEVVLAMPQVGTRMSKALGQDARVYIAEMLARGEDALRAILPMECNQHESWKRRETDAALLFLCYPLRVVSTELESKILSDVNSKLKGAFGIRRYIGDSYWCANYKKLIDADRRTADFSDNLASRDRFLLAGGEAQWCIFDPVISCYWGQLIIDGSSTESTSVYFEKQKEHLRRSLCQLTRLSHTSVAYRCPESYYCDEGNWVPNDITPLLWTQANLMQSLHLFEKVVARMGTGLSESREQTQ